MENQIVVVVKGVILFDNKVLIIKRDNKDGIGAGTWECVGGKIEFGEELESALRREVKEEVGLDIFTCMQSWLNTQEELKNSFIENIKNPPQIVH